MLPSNADAAYRFRQNSNFQYLTGIDQENCALLLFPSAPLESQREILFIRRADEHLVKWEGWKYSPDEARAASGVQTIKYWDELESTLRSLIGRADPIYIDTEEHDRHSLFYPTVAHRWAYWVREQYPAHQLRRLNPLLAAQRLIKYPEEVAQMERACQITEVAFRELLVQLRPGMMEFEVEALLYHQFIRQGSRGPAYEPIVASGANATILHYTLNSQPCRDGDLLLLDAGAEYGYYASDMSRTVPVNGRYTPRQRAVYEAVLDVMQFAISLLTPGRNPQDYADAVHERMDEALIGLRLLTAQEIKDAPEANPARRRYFYHGIGHPLGLDVHDVGDRYAIWQAGMVLTVEPGIYIAEEGIGVRIENNILITPQGPRDLMGSIPITVDEIEALMNQ
jgi:Xaa-Pro aminopeptidase